MRRFLPVPESRSESLSQSISSLSCLLGRGPPAAQGGTFAARCRFLYRPRYRFRSEWRLDSRDCRLRLGPGSFSSTEAVAAVPSIILFLACAGPRPGPSLGPGLSRRTCYLSAIRFRSRSGSVSRNPEIALTVRELRLTRRRHSQLQVDCNAPGPIKFRRLQASYG